MRSSACCSAAVLAVVFSAVAGSLPAAVQPAEQVFVYPLDRLATSGLPADLVRQRTSDPLFAPCGADPAARAFPAILVPLVMAGFKALLGLTDKAIKAREDRRIAALSHSFAGHSTYADFPLRPRAERSACLVVDRVTVDGTAVTARSTYVIGLRPFGANALGVELLAARVADTALLRGGKVRTLNADLAVTIATVEQPRDGLAVQRTLGTFTTTLKGIDPALPGARPAGDQPILLLPLPLPGAPTSLTVAVTESNAGLAAVKERVALQRKLRAKLLEFAGDVVEDKLDGK